MNPLKSFVEGFLGSLNAELLAKAEPFIIDEAQALVKVGERAVQILFNFELSAEEKADAWDGWQNHFALFAEACKREGSVLAGSITEILLTSFGKSIRSIFQQ